MPATMQMRAQSSSVRFRLPDIMPDSEAEWLQHCQQIVRRTSASYSFYIGITADPVRRMEEGHSRSGFDMMVVIAAVASSAVSGSLERGLLGSINGHPNCMNQSWGGESPTPGYPHYVYVVSRSDGLMRSNRSFGSRWSADVASDLRMWSGIYGR